MSNPADVAPDVLARELEVRGYDSLWIGEHTHIPVSRATPYPAGGELPALYRMMMDPFLTLMAAAAATERLSVGTCVALPLQHDVFDLAKTVATLDRLSGGRVLFGVGVGWNVEELANHRPIRWSQRYRALAECVAALRRSGATRSPSSTASSSTSIPSGCSRSRSSNRTRRCSAGWAASSARARRSRGPTGGCRWTSPSVTWGRRWVCSAPRSSGPVAIRTRSRSRWSRSATST